MSNAHLIVGHAAASPLNRLRTISFEPKRREISSRLFEKHRDQRLDRFEEVLRAAAIIDAWLDGTITLSRGFTPGEIDHLRTLLLLWAFDWIEVFGEIGEQTRKALDAAMRFIDDHADPSFPFVPFALPWPIIEKHMKKEGSR